MPSAPAAGSTAEEEVAEPAQVESSDAEGDARPALEVFCFGPQRVLLDGSPIANWPNGRGRSIFNYLVAHRSRPTPKEVLMDLFWPGAEAAAARNNLNATIYALRRLLARPGASLSYVIYRSDCYQLNREIDLWVDTDAFSSALAAGSANEQAGRIDEAILDYRHAERIYLGEYLAEERYDNWLLDLRRRYQHAFARLGNRLSALYFERQAYDDCIAVCDRQLAIDRCDEGPHRLLMRCYGRLGQQHLALRQFYDCRDALARDLDTPPSPETVALFHRMRSRQRV